MYFITLIGKILYINISNYVWSFTLNNITLGKIFTHYLSKIWVQNVVRFIATVIGSLLLKNPLIDTTISLKHNLTNQRSFLIFIVIYSIIEFVLYRLNVSEHRKYLDANFMDNFINSIQLMESTLLKDTQQLSEKKEKVFFDKSAQDVCSILQDMLSKNYPSVGVRVCITKYYVDDNGKRYIKQAGYRSSTRMASSNQIRTLSSFNYYVGDIIRSDSEDYIMLLTPEKVNEKLKFSKKKAKEVRPKQFIAISSHCGLKKSGFVLQIDFDKENTLDLDQAKVQSYINKYIRPFVLRLSTIYYSDQTRNFYDA